MGSSPVRVWGALAVLGVAAAIGGSVAGGQAQARSSDIDPIPIPGIWHHVEQIGGFPQADYVPTTIRVAPGGGGYTVYVGKEVVFKMTTPWGEQRRCQAGIGVEAGEWRSSGPSRFDEYVYVPTQWEKGVKIFDLNCESGWYLSRRWEDVELVVKAVQRYVPGKPRWELWMTPPGNPEKQLDAWYSDTPVVPGVQVFLPPEPVPSTGPDTTAPVSTAFPAVMVQEVEGKLSFSVWDDRGTVGLIDVAVYRGTPCPITDDPTFSHNPCQSSGRHRFEHLISEASATGALRSLLLSGAGLDRLSEPGVYTWCVWAYSQGTNKYLTGNRSCAPLAVIAKSAKAPPTPAKLHLQTRKGIKTIGGGPKPTQPTKPTPPPTTKGDHTAPTVEALPASGKRGQPIELRFKVSDRSGVTQETISIRRGNERLENTLNFHQTKAGMIYKATYTPNVSTFGTLTWCVQSRDKAGNESAFDCAPLVVA